jgi:Domain of unknown function (DUF5667)
MHPFTDEQLIAYATGELRSDASASVARHVEHCAQCAAAINRYQRIVALLRADMTAEPPPTSLARAEKIYSRKRLVVSALARRLNSPPIQGRRLVVGLALLVVLIFGALIFGPASTFAAATQDSIPGDALYPAKIAVENVHLAFTFDTVGKANVYLTLAEERVKEIESLSSKGKYTAIVSTAQAYVDQITQADNLLKLGKKQNAVVTACAQHMEHVLKRSSNALAKLLITVPDEAKPAIVHAINVTEASKPDAQQLLIEATPVLPLSAAPTTAPVPTASPVPKPHSNNSVLGQATPTEQRNDSITSQPTTLSGQGNGYLSEYNASAGPPNQPLDQPNPPAGPPNQPPGQQNHPSGPSNQPSGQQNHASGPSNQPPGQPHSPAGPPNQPPGQPHSPAGPPNQPPGQQNQPFGQHEHSESTRRRPSHPYNVSWDTKT